MNNQYSKLKNGNPIKQRQGFCIFCNSSGLSKEHVWPKWMHPFLKSEQEYTQFLAKPFYNDHAALFSPDIKIKNCDLKTLKVRVVCARKCNNGWMSRLENDAKELIKSLMQGEGISLNLEEQKLISSWLSVKTVVAEYTDKTTLSITKPERDHIFQTLTPPSHWNIYIARCLSEEWEKRYLHNVGTIQSSRTKVFGYPIPNTQITTFGLGQLYAHIFSSTSELLDKSNIKNVDGISGLNKIWPISDQSIDWASTKILSAEEARLISNRF